MEPLLAADGLTVGYRGADGGSAPRGEPRRRMRRALRGRAVLAGLTVGLPRGRLVCLLGANGSGKSTLLRTLTGMQPPLAGAVRLAGVPLARLSRAERARRLAVVLTDRIAAGGLTGTDLVALGRAPYTGWSGRLRARDREVIGRALRLTGSTGLADRPLSRLSDGERQRLMVARALAQEPEVIVLDEPTAFLDAPGRAELTGMLRDLAHREGLAILLSTHDVEVALRTADAAWLLLPGGRCRAGAPEDLVLAGELDHAFAGGGHRFDPLTGGFLTHAPVRGTAVVDGPDSLVTAWTRRALHRAGYRTDRGPASPAGVRVSCTAAGDGYRWHATTGVGTIEHGSLADLVERLRVG